MEKRTVRIYKAPDGQGKFINKTSQFLQKAQQGAQVQQSQENRMQQYAKLVYDKLSNEDTPEEVYDVLVQQGLSSEIAQAMISQIMQKMIDNGELDPAYNENDEAENGEQQEAPEEEEQASVNAEEEEVTESNMPYAEDETVEEEEGNEPWAADMYQEGGEAYVSNQYDDQNSEKEEVQDYESLVENTPGKQSQLQFSNTDAYLPDYTPLAWENIEALQPQQSLKHGGMPSKKSFVKNVMSIIKRQAGGEGADKSNSVGKGNPFDTETNTLEKRKTGFLSTLKDQTTKAKTEDIYKKLMSSNDPDLHKVASTLAGQEQAPQDNAFPEQPYAQVGGFIGGEDPLYRFVYGGDDEVNPEYYEEGMLPEAQDGKTVDPWEGYEIKKAKVTYTPRVKTTAGGLRGTLLPWNPIGRVTGQTAQQVGNPYNLKDNTPYTGSVQGQTPIARHVTKTTMFGRRPKEWIDIYQAPGNVYGVKPNAPQETPSSRTPERTLSREELKKMRKEEQGTKKIKEKVSISKETTPEKVLSREELAALRKQDEYVKMMENTRNKKEQESKNTIKFKAPTEYIDPLEDKWFGFSDKKSYGDYHNLKNQKDLQFQNEIVKSIDKTNPVKSFGKSSLQDFTYPNFFEKRRLNKIANERDQRLANEYDNEQAEYEAVPNKKFVYGNDSEEEPEYQYGGSLSKYLPGGLTDPSAINKRKSDSTSMMADQEGYLGSPIGRPTFGRSETYADQNLANTVGRQPMTAMPRINDLKMDAESAEDKAIREEMAGVASQPMTAMPTIQAPQLQVNSPEYVGVKNKAENQRSFDGEAGVNVFNAGTQGVLGIIDRRQKAEQERQMMEDEFNADNLYGTSTEKDRGDWVDYGSQLGQYRFDQMGQDRSGRFSYGQEGGYMQEGGFTEGEEVEMTEAELADFIANGGEVEYI